MQKIILHCIFVVGPLTSWLFSRVWVKAIQGYLIVALGFCCVLENCIYSNIFYLQAEILNDHLKDKDFFTLVQRPLKFFVILDSQMPFECAVCFLHVLYVIYMCCMLFTCAICFYRTPDSLLCKDKQVYDFFYMFTGFGLYPKRDFFFNLLFEQMCKQKHCCLSDLTI